ncbi:MAG: dephospho-CoA kinase [Pelovirga sp.]
MILGITGNIASGKSTVARELERRGAVVVDADQLAREVVVPGSPTLARLVDAFDEGILHPDGSLNRTEMGRRIFADDRAREVLNGIMHPAIARLSGERLHELRCSSAPLVVYQAPLLYEAGAQGRVDKVLMVKIAPPVQLARLMARDDLDADQARQRIAAQMSQDEKIARADYLVDNSGTLEETVAQIDRLWPELVGAAAAADAGAPVRRRDPG